MTTMEFSWSTVRHGLDLASVTAFLSVLLWPAVVVSFGFFYRKSIGKLLTAVIGRIESGDTFEAGGVRIGRAPKLEDQGRGPIESDLGDAPEYYLVHVARRDSRLDENGNEYRRLSIWIDNDDEDLSDIVSVRYELHPTFKDPIREVTSPAGNFKLKTSAWGQFILRAVVTKRNRSTESIQRYINF